MGIDLAIAFFVGLIWWEYVALFVIVVGFGASLNENSAVWALVLVGAFILIPWTGLGAIFATLTFSGVIGYGIVFLLIGVLWSVFKWSIFVREKIAYYSKNKNYKYSKEEVKEKISDSKSNDQIAFWIIMWPFSSLGYFVNDFVYDFVISIVKRISKVYDRITDGLIDSSTLKETKEGK